MKLYNFLFAFMATVFTATAVNAQTVIPGFESPVYGGFAHVANPMSLTVRDTVTSLGNQTNLLRTASIRNHNNSGQPFQVIPGVTQFVGLGVDSFNIPATSIFNLWEMQLDYRYTSDPDGPGLLIAGSSIPGFPREFLVDVLPHTNLAINFMAMVGPYLHIEAIATPYTRPGYITHYIVEVRDPLGNVSIDSTNVEPGWPTGYDDIFPIYAGEYCITIRIRYTHDGPGNQSDFVGLLIDSVSQCEYCPGLATDVSGPDGPKPCCLKISPNPADGGWVTIENFDTSRPFMVFDLEGRLVQQHNSSSIMDISSLVAGYYMVRQEDGRACRLVVIRQ